MAKRMNNTEERKKQLLDVAEELFLKHGYYGVNLDDVAAGASVVRGTVLHYFDSKEKGAEGSGSFDRTYGQQGPVCS